MKIKREINGQEVEITLTDAEIYAAYHEQKRNYSIEDIQTKLEEMLTKYEDYPDEYQTDIGGRYRTITVGSLKKALNDAEWLNNTAECFEKALDKNDCFMDSFWGTAKYVIEDELEDE